MTTSFHILSNSLLTSHPLIDFCLAWASLNKYTDHESYLFTDFQIGHSGDLPRTLCDDYENDIEFLKKAHHVLLEVRIT
jgi:hypothetical protein